MYACNEVSGGQCVEWVELVYGLPPLTQQEVLTLGASFTALYATAFCLGVLVRMLLNSTASRHGA